MVVTPMRDKPHKPAPGKASTSDEGSDLMKTDEVLAVLEISKPTLYKLIEEGTLTPLPKNPLLKRPRRLLFKREDVERLIEQQDEQARQD